MATAREQIAPLTSVRIFAAVLVVIFHYGRGIGPFAAGWLHRVTSCAGSAVAFFFFLSGFILAYAYQGCRWSEPGALKKYYVARLARIYPVYLLALLMTFLLGLSGVYWDRLSALDAAVTLPIHIGLLQAWLPDYVYKLNVPGWSLSVEASFYLVFPLILPRLMALRRSVALAVFGGTFVVSQLVLGLARSVIWKDWFYGNATVHHTLMYHPLVYGPVFVMGILAFNFFRPDARVFSSKTPWMGGLSVVSIGLIVFFSYWAGDYLNYSIHVGMLAPLYGALIFSLCDPDNWVSRALSHPWMQHLGEASYSVYILQMPIYRLWLWAGFVPAGDGWLFLLYLVSLLAFSLASFRWFETPLRRWMRRSWAKS